ncbi:hypothetical protein J2732_001208 [Achromobacter deleyi]|uniref:restriction endonuclease n=1 Tax=Achromobacter deleyi TaxID=1353891 RepID=UPI00286698A5|nr:restriction endonuclease [Achromobacter deleyi]MDR6600225.1 hypothetical protein [Achromobacter deleyi]
MLKTPRVSPAWALAFVGFLVLAEWLGAGIAVSLVLLMVIAYCILNEWFWRRHEAAEHERQLVREGRLHGVILKHKRVLQRKRRQGRFQDEYGIWNEEKWHRDLRHFVTKVLPYEMDPDDLDQLGDAASLVVAYLDELEDDADISDEVDLRGKDSPQSQGHAFEHSCAQILREQGWRARVTTASGDQGVDIEAEREGYRVVVQCKFYSSTVGNGAVQEIAAGRLHYQADLGIVVSRTSFTPAARQLAQTTGVVLVDYDDLHDINMLIPALADEKTDLDEVFDSPEIKGLVQQKARIEPRLSTD